MMPRPFLALAALVLIAAGAPPSAPTGEARPTGRFPQPVRVGDLLGRAVLEPIEAQPVLGRVRAVVRRPDGTLAMVIGHGGLLGFGTRPAAVPLDAVALLGEHVALLDLTPAQLDALPTAAAPGTPLPPDETVRMGLVGPFH